MTGGAMTSVALLGTSFLPDPLQLELLRDPNTGDLPRSAIVTVRGRGRPPGARNKRTKKIADLYVQRYGDPLDAIGQLANTPLRQLVEILREADNADEREAQLAHLAETIEDHLTAALARGGLEGSKGRGLTALVDRLADVAKVLRATPGKLAIDALALQFQAHRTALEYVHGKQPIAIDLRKSADVVIVAPEILQEHGIDAEQLANAIAEQGLDAFDAGNMRLLGAEDAEFEDVDATPEGDEQ